VSGEGGPARFGPLWIGANALVVSRPRVSERAPAGGFAPLLLVLLLEASAPVPRHTPAPGLERRRRVIARAAGAEAIVVGTPPRVIECTSGLRSVAHRPFSGHFADHTT
jgi:hypothetical protein